MGGICGWGCQGEGAVCGHQGGGGLVSSCMFFLTCLTLFEVGEEELSEWRLKHRESVRRERGEQAGKGAESHDEVVSFFYCENVLST